MEDFLMIDALVKRGVYQCDIAAEPGVSPKTVSRVVARGSAPAGHARRGSLVDAYRPQIGALLNGGVWNAQVILRELQTAGYSGGISTLRGYIGPKRPQRVSRATVRFETLPSLAGVGCPPRRCTPLRPDVAAISKAWLRERQGSPGDPLFPSSRAGVPLNADALQGIVARHTLMASRACPSLRTKRVTPHTLRHAAAMALLQRGVDPTVIVLWLGHESTESTEVYLQADMRLKGRALAHATTAGVTPRRFQAPDRLLAFLEAL
jgi:hypothetical protein